jgi:hypothetical protein
LLKKTAFRALCQDRAQATKWRDGTVFAERCLLPSETISGLFLSEGSGGHAAAGSH